MRARSHGFGSPVDWPRSSRNTRGAHSVANAFWRHLTLNGAVLLIVKVHLVLVVMATGQHQNDNGQYVIEVRRGALFLAYEICSKWRAVRGSHCQ